ncbi:MAG TPA: hypothetical protein VJJ79_00250 [Candidatus Nanoarchaeia archaeon]|nr:hypothetical protein [Candidatus Nanoarchaeia archaeon]
MNRSFYVPKADTLQYLSLKTLHEQAIMQCAHRGLYVAALVV